jgi:hypothetical protein
MTDLPTIVAEFDRNDRERVRIVLDRYHGVAIVSIKNLYRDAAGELRYGRGGIGMAVRHLPVLAEAVNAALERARALGLVPADGGDSST